VYRGLMVDMRPLNEKLRGRAVDMVARLSDRPPEAAAEALRSSAWNIKQAVLIAGGASPEEASRRLDNAHGNLRAARGASA
jgi:N-acetylmuramic acid 6-phosphate etherase